MRRLVPVVLLFAAVLLVIWWQSADSGPAGPARDDDARPAAEAGGDLVPVAGIAASLPVPSVLFAEGGRTLRAHVLRDGAPVVARVEVFRILHFGPRVHSGRAGDPPRRTLLASVVTNAGGRCEVRGLSWGPYLVVARAEDGATECRDWRGSSGILRMELTDRCQVLLGRARYADGRPFRGRAEVEDGPETAVNEDGTFRLRGLPEGRFALHLVAPGRISVTRWIGLPRDDELLVIVDEDFETVEGWVLAAEDDRPIPDAEVILSVRDQVVARTDADGRFRVAAPLSMELVARVSAADYAPAAVKVRRDTKIEIRLLRRCALTGRVVDAAGRPIAGVTVSAFYHPYHPDGLRTAGTGTDGTFTLDGLSPGEMFLSAGGGGWVSELETMNTSWQVDPDRFRLRPGETRDVEIVLVRAGAIEGSVHGTDGTPRAGVTVTAKTPDDWDGSRASLVTSTGSEGRYRLEGIVPGFPYEISALAAAGRAVRKGPVRVESGAVVTVDLAFLPERWVDLTVRMRASGHPVAGAGVTVRFGESSLHLLTDAEGKARIGPLPDEGGTVRVDHGGCLCSRVPVPIPAGQDHLLIEMPSALFIAGRATENGGRPAGGVRVHVGDPDDVLDDYELERVELVGRDGKFRIGPLPRGTWEISFWGGGSQRGERLRVRADAGTEDLLLELPPAADEPEEDREEDPDLGVMTVRWVGPDGHRAMGGRVDFQHDAPQSPLWITQRNSGEFRYRIKALGVPVRFEVSGATTGNGDPLGPARSGLVRTGPEEVLIRLPAARSIEGRVLDEKGRGLRGFRVFARRASDEEDPARHWHGSVTTATDGAFRVDGLGDFLYSLEVNTPPEYVRPDPRTLKPGASRVEFRLRRSARITVRVLDPDGTPLPGTLVIALRRPDRKRLFHAQSREKGIAVFAGLDPEREYDLRINAVRGDWAWSAERIRPGAAPVVARLAPGLSIRGRFEVPMGAERFEVYAEGQGASVWGEVGSDGTFTIRGLSPGRWNVSLFAGGKGKERWSGQADIAAGGEVTIKLSAD